jgi:hypothetical protein
LASQRCTAASWSCVAARTARCPPAVRRPAQPVGRPVSGSRSATHTGVRRAMTPLLYRAAPASRVGDAAAPTAAGLRAVSGDRPHAPPAGRTSTTRGPPSPAPAGSATNSASARSPPRSGHPHAPVIPTLRSARAAGPLPARTAGPGVGRRRSVDAPGKAESHRPSPHRGPDGGTNARRRRPGLSRRHAEAASPVPAITPDRGGAPEDAEPTRTTS